MYKCCQILFYIIVILSISGCTEQEKGNNTLIVATSADNPPYEFYSNNEIIGFDIDLIKEIAQRLKKEIVIKDMTFHGLLAALSNNKSVDLVISGITITPLRKPRADFSNSYHSEKASILYKKTNQIFTIEDLDNKNVGTQLGSIWSFVMRDLSKQYHINLVNLSSNLELLEELKVDRIDAMIIETSQAKRFVLLDNSLTFFIIDYLNSDLGIVMPKNSPLQQNINKIIEDLKSDGTLNKLKEKWQI